MRVLGIDPGIATTGWGVVEWGGPDSFRALGYGCIITTAKQPMMERLQKVGEGIRRLVKKEQPQSVAIEELFFAKNSGTAASVGHARGVILYVLGELGMDVHEYNPRSVKTALTGFGAADKPQMQRMVQRLLKLPQVPKPDDAADALAIALCHINTLKVQ